jgi:hypothetical protein
VFKLAGASANDPDHIVEGVRDLPGHAGPVVRQVSGKVSASQCHQGCQELFGVELSPSTRDTLARRVLGVEGFFISN